MRLLVLSAVGAVVLAAAVASSGRPPGVNFCDFPATRTYFHSKGGRYGSPARCSMLAIYIYIRRIGLVLLLVAAGLLLHSFVRLQAVDPGFDGERVLTLGIDLDPQRYPSPESRSGIFQELAGRLGALPGVETASYGDSVPFTDVSMIVRGLRAEGRPFLDPEQQPEVAVTTVGPDYFRALGIRLVRGRGFTARDTAGAQLVAVISERMARTFWGDEDPLGRLFHRGRNDVTVVGIATDHCVRATALDAVHAGYATTVDTRYTAGVLPETTRNAIEEMRDAGVDIVEPAVS